MEDYKKLLLGNKAWIQDRLGVNPDYFKKLGEGQNPEFLWIGCADSRVPANEITGTDAGDIFVHRNIANLVIHTDFSMLSVLQYAVEHLKVNHIVVCGHYDCGGVKAALTDTDFGLLNKWLRHIKDVYRLYERELRVINDEKKRGNRLVELNVIEQVNNVAETSIVQRSWKERNAPTVHGWVFDLDTGILHDVTRIEPGTHLDSIYEYRI